MKMPKALAHYLVGWIEAQEEVIRIGPTASRVDIDDWETLLLRQAKKHINALRKVAES